MLEVGDYAVCPGHGVGRICEIDEQQCDSVEESKITFYKVKFIADGMTVMVPTDSPGGIRRLVNDKEVDNIFDLLKDHDVEVDNSAWNRRQRDYLSKVNTGSLIEIAKVLRSLCLLKRQKNLSFGEKKMLNQCENLLVEELAITKGVESQDVKSMINSCLEI